MILLITAFILTIFVILFAFPLLLCVCSVSWFPVKSVERIFVVLFTVRIFLVVLVLYVIRNHMETKPICLVTSLLHGFIYLKCICNILFYFFTSLIIVLTLIKNYIFPTHEFCLFSGNKLKTPNSSLKT